MSARGRDMRGHGGNRRMARSEFSYLGNMPNLEIRESAKMSESDGGN